MANIQLLNNNWPKQSNAFTKLAISYVNNMFDVEFISNLNFEDDKNNDKQNVSNLFLALLAIKAKIVLEKHSNKKN